MACGVSSANVTNLLPTRKRHARRSFTEYAEIEAAHAGGADLPDEVDARLGEIETALEAYDNHPAVYRPDDLAIAGAFVSIDGSGKLRVERGYVRPEDELPVTALLDDNAGEGSGGATT